MGEDQAVAVGGFGQMQVAADFGVGGVVDEVADGSGHILDSLNPHAANLRFFDL